MNQKKNKNIVKLIIRQQDKSQFQKLFKFFLENECELCLFPEGLKWRNHCANGIVYKQAFAEYPFNYRRKLGSLKRQNLLKWFNTNWKDIKGTLNTEIPIGS